MRYPSFWVKASPRKKRVYSIIAVFVVSVLATIIGTAVPISSQDASTISNQLNQTLSEHQANNTLTTFIFFNNFTICLLMFVPLVGAALGLFILFETGIALGAITATQGFPAWLGLISLAITPVFWLEFAAYSVAMASSIWLIRRIIQALQAKEPQGWRRILGYELKWTGISIGICAGLLAVGAVVEVWLITAFG